jgi:hypothetical protein
LIDVPESEKPVIVPTSSSQPDAKLATSSGFGRKTLLAENLTRLPFSVAPSREDAKKSNSISNYTGARSALVARQSRPMN